MSRIVNRRASTIFRESRNDGAREKRVVPDALLCQE